MRGIGLFSIPYTIELFNSEEFYGRVNHATQIIYIDPRHSRDICKKTLLHEVLHIIEAAAAIEIEDEDIRRLASGLHSFFMENGGYPEWIEELASSIIERKINDG